MMLTSYALPRGGALRAASLVQFPMTMGGDFRIAHREAEVTTYFAENLNTVCWWNVSPGFRIVLGKSGWFGESG